MSLGIGLMCVQGLELGLYQLLVCPECGRDILRGYQISEEFCFHCSPYALARYCDQNRVKILIRVRGVMFSQCAYYAGRELEDE